MQPLQHTTGSHRQQQFISLLRASLKTIAQFLACLAATDQLDLQLRVNLNTNFESRIRYMLQNFSFITIERGGK